MKCWLCSATLGSRSRGSHPCGGSVSHSPFSPGLVLCGPSLTEQAQAGAQQTCSIQLNSSQSRVSTSPLFSVGLLGPGWPIALLELKSICQTVYVRQREGDRMNGKAPFALFLLQEWAWFSPPKAGTISGSHWKGRKGPKCARTAQHVLLCDLCPRAGALLGQKCPTSFQRKFLCSHPLLRLAPRNPSCSC